MSDEPTRELGANDNGKRWAAVSAQLPHGRKSSANRSLLDDAEQDGGQDEVAGDGFISF